MPPRPLPLSPLLPRLAVSMIAALTLTGLPGPGQAAAADPVPPAMGGPSGETGGDEGTDEVVLYCGRSKALVDPLIRRFTEQTGIQVKVNYAKTAPLALMLIEEGDRSPADVFWAQDAGTLGALAQQDLLAPLPAGTLGRVPEQYTGADGLWVGTSGRLRVFAYAPDRLTDDEKPASVFDLTAPKYKGRVGWAPTNASFQAFVTAMRKTHGQDITGQWLLDMKANGTRAFPKNTAIIQGIAAGQIDLGLPNHYYLLRFKTTDKNYPVEQAQFAAGDIGNLNNLAGVGILKTSRHKAAAAQLIDFLLADPAQQYFVGQTFELPVVEGIIIPSRLLDPDTARANLPDIDLDALTDIEGTQQLLREAGLL